MATQSGSLSKSLIPLALLVGFGLGLVASVNATVTGSGHESDVVIPPEVCEGCQAEWNAWYHAIAVKNAAILAEQQAAQAYQDCMEGQGGGPSDPPRLNDSGESILASAELGDE